MKAWNWVLWFGGLCCGTGLAAIATYQMARGRCGTVMGLYGGVVTGIGMIASTISMLRMRHG